MPVAQWDIVTEFITRDDMVGKSTVWASIK